MLVEQRVAGHMQNFTYVVGDPATKRAILVDPSFDAGIGIAVAEEHGYAIEVVLDTHEHPDHCLDNEGAKRRTGARVMAHRLADVPAKDRDLEDGEILKVGELKVRVHHTPGHSPGSVLYQVGKHVFTGDTLFVGEIGRVDLHHSDPDAMFDSLERLSKLDPGLIVAPGHDYGRTPTSTIARELAENPYLRIKDRREFLRIAL